MGTDKATLVVDGLPLVEHVRRAIVDAGIDEIVIAGPGHVSDPEPAQGPMAGIVAGWSRLCEIATDRWDPVVVLACDLPGLDESTVRALLRRAPEHRHGAVAHDGARPQPLVAAYRADALCEIARAFGEGERSVRRCFDGWDLGAVDVDASKVADADRPEDLRGFAVEWPS